MDDLYRGVYFEHNPGWDSISEEIVDFVLDNGGEVHQVKEKFAVLTIYADMPTKELQIQLYEKLHVAEERSLQTCEYCGKPGKVRPGRWMKTLCDEHA